MRIFKIENQLDIWDRLVNMFQIDLESQGIKFDEKLEPDIYLTEMKGDFKILFSFPIMYFYKHQTKFFKSFYKIFSISKDDLDLITKYSERCTVTLKIKADNYLTEDFLNMIKRLLNNKKKSINFCIKTVNGTENIKDCVCNSIDFYRQFDDNNHYTLEFMDKSGDYYQYYISDIQEVIFE